MTFQDKIQRLSGGMTALEFGALAGVSEAQVYSWRKGKCRPRGKNLTQLEVRMYWIFGVKNLLSDETDMPDFNARNISMQHWIRKCEIRQQQHFWETHLYASELAWRMAGDKRFGSPEHYIFSCPECGWARDWKSTNGGRICPVCGHVAENCFITLIRSECGILIRCGDHGYTERRFRFWGLSRDDAEWQRKAYKP